MQLLTIEAFRDYVETHIDEIIDEGFLNFGSADVLTHLPNNKGKAIMNTSTVSSDIVQKWKELGLADFAQKVDMGLVEVDSYRGQFKDKYVPEALENVYLGALRKSGQDPKDFPFEAHILQLLVKAIAQFNEKVLWQAVTAGGDSGMDAYDGLLKQLTDAITATDVTPTTYETLWKPKNNTEATPANSTSIIDVVEGLAHQLPVANRSMGLNVYMSVANKVMYDQAYRNVFGARPTQDMSYNISRTMVDGTEGAPVYIVPVAGMGASNRIIVTPQWNAVYTYDVAEDASTFNYQWIFNVFHIFGAFRYGSKFLILDDNWIACNELA